MKKIYFLALLVFITTTGMAQNLVTNGGLESWDDPNSPSSWDVFENINQESIQIHQGSFSAAHTSDESTKDLRQDLDGITGGQTYTITYYYKDNDPMARTRIWSYWMEDGNYLDDDAEVLRPGQYSEDNGDWQQFQVELTAPMNANQFRFEVRVYKQDGSWGGMVYYDDFSFEQDQTTYPEPSNYPTAFEANSAGQSIVLDWEDAVGTQLPGAYLILGEILPVKGVQLDPPMDGEPVTDDLDWTDGQAAINVLYGQETYSFANLPMGEHYQFTIYPYTNSGANIDYKTDGTAPTATASVSLIIIINEEGFENDLGTWTPYSVTGDQEWYQDTYNDQTFAKMSGFDGGSNENEDWLISPELEFIDAENAYFNFISAMNYTGPDLQLFVSTDYGGTGDPNGFEWDELTQDAIWSDGGWSWVASGEVDISEYMSQGTYLAFKYTSTDAESATWELDDLLVYGTSTLSINDHAEASFSIFPNPTSDQLNIRVENKGKLRISNAMGQLVMEQALEQGHTTISLQNLLTGMYVITFTDEQQASKTHKLMVN